MLIIKNGRDRLTSVADLNLYIEKLSDNVRELVGEEREKAIQEIIKARQHLKQPKLWVAMAVDPSHREKTMYMTAELGMDNMYLQPNIDKAYHFTTVDGLQCAINRFKSFSKATRKWIFSFVECVRI